MSVEHTDGVGPPPPWWMHALLAPVDAWLWVRARAWSAYDRGRRRWLERHAGDVR